MFMIRNPLLYATLLTATACVQAPPPNMAELMKGAQTAAVGGIVLEDFATSDTTDTTTTNVSSTTIEYLGVRKQMALFKRNTNIQLSTTNRPNGTSTFVVQNSSNTSQPGITSSSTSSEISGDGSGTTVINKQTINFSVDLKQADKSIIVNDSKIVIIAAEPSRLIYKVGTKK